MPIAATPAQLEAQIAHELDIVAEATERIRLVLQDHADKTFKGGEVTGWLGEVYAKLLLGGDIVDDSYDYDLIAADGRRVAVKARRQVPGKSGWAQTSPIPRITGDDMPTHLLFLRLNESFRLQDQWLIPWDHLITSDRFKSHKVHGVHRAYVVRIAPTKDSDWLWPNGANWEPSPSLD